MDIAINQENRDEVVKILNHLLADEYVLYTKTRKFHWNVLGPHFSELHKFFEGQYEQLDEIIDEVAERARALGGVSFGTLAEFGEATRLNEAPGQNPNAPEMIKDLLADHETIIRQLRTDLESCDEKYRDAGTNDFLTGLMEQHEKMAWMLRSYLQA